MGKSTCPENCMPWSLNLPIFDEKKGCYVSRTPAPAPEPKKPDFATLSANRELTPLDKGYNAYMKAKRKREAGLEKKATKKDVLARQSHGVSKTVKGQGQACKKDKKKLCPWEKTGRARKSRKVLSVRGERV